MVIKLGNKVHISKELYGATFQKKREGISMKRFLAIFLLVVMLPSVGLVEESRSDTAKMVQDYAKSLVESLISLYESYPSGFDDDYAFLLYSYFKMYNDMSKVYQAELRMDVKSNPLSGGKVIIDDTSKKTASMEFAVFGYMDDIYKQWLDGEITTDEFCGRIVPIIKSGFN